MSRITNTILSPSIPNPHYKKYLNGRLTLTLIIPSHPSRCESWNDYQKVIAKGVAREVGHTISDWSQYLACIMFINLFSASIKL